MNQLKKVNAIQTIDASDFFKTTNYNTNFNKIEKKNTDDDFGTYSSTREFNKVTAETFAARLAQANSASKTYIAYFVKKTNFDEKLKRKLNDKVTLDR